MTDNHNEIINGESTCWYAIRTYNRQEMEISKFLKKKDLPHFIPMIYTQKAHANEKPKRVLVPVVHNLLFMQKTLSEKEILKTLNECPVPLNILKKEGTCNCYEIPDRQMTEFRALCDPNYEDTVYVTQEEADAKKGKNVRIVCGPFKGVTGKLVRFNNRYFIVKTLVSVGVMLRISRWYCEIIE